MASKLRKGPAIADRPHIFDPTQPPPMPQGPPRSHKTTFMDSGWTIQPAVHPITGTPAIGIIAVDGSELVIYPFDDVLTFATFRRECDGLAEQYRARAQAAEENGSPDDEV